MREGRAASSTLIGTLVACGVAIPACYLSHGRDGDEPGESAFALHPQLARGSDHACVLLGDGSVHCWGGNTFGQLGRGELSASAVGEPPARVEGLPPIRQISASSAQTCALDIHGRVYCWGLNEQGQLGIGLDAPQEDACAEQGYRGSCVARPTEVAGLDEIVQVTAGGTHACALRADERVLCWGWMALSLADSAQTAPSSTAGMPGASGDYAIFGTPAIMQGVAAARQIAAGANSAGPGHTCAALDDGRVQCWGNYTFGQTGPVEPGLDARRPLPPERAGFALEGKAVQVAAGSSHSCAVTEDGAVYCWGANTQRQLGTDTGYRGCEGVDGPCEPTPPETWRITTPLRVAGIEDAIAVSIHQRGAFAKELQTCLLRRDGTVTCWHEGRKAQVPGLSDVVELSGNCATVGDGRIFCWKPEGTPELVPELRLLKDADGLP